MFGNSLIACPQGASTALSKHASKERWCMLLQGAWQKQPLVHGLRSPVDARRGLLGQSVAETAPHVRRTPPLASLRRPRRVAQVRTRGRFCHKRPKSVHQHPQHILALPISRPIKPLRRQPLPCDDRNPPPRAPSLLPKKLLEQRLLPEAPVRARWPDAPSQLLGNVDRHLVHLVDAM